MSQRLDLTPAGRDELLDLVLQLNDCGMTIVLVSHSMEDVARTARRIIVINDTRIAYDGSVAEVFSHVRELTDMGLSVPQVSLVIDRPARTRCGFAGRHLYGGAGARRAARAF